MRIAEMNDCIERLRKIYKFDDARTEIEFDDDDCMNAMTIKTEDESGVIVTLRAYVEHKTPIARLLCE